MSKYAVIYSSLTGNTEKIAVSIYQALPASSKDICKIDLHITSDFATNYFIGFNIENKTAPKAIVTFLKQLHGKSVALFATGGYISNKFYYYQLLYNLAHILPKDNKYLGLFICQGKMPISVRNEYQKMLLKNSHHRKILKLMHNFDIAMLHPNEEDEKNATSFTLNAINKINKASLIL